MLIESKIRREGGTPVQMGGVHYEFRPASAAADAPHVCEVKDEEHIARFLGIAEGFKLASKEAKKADAPPAPPAPAPVAPATAPAGEPPAAASANPPVPPAPSLVIKNGRKKIDLATMNKKALLAFAKAEGFEVDREADVGALRTEIHKQATAE